MKWEDYQKIEGKHGPDSEEAKHAYLEMILTELEPITESSRFDEWGAAILTLKEAFVLTPSQLETILDLQGEFLGRFRFGPNNQLKIEEH